MLMYAISFSTKDPDSRYTYSQRFNSATVLPIDPATVQKDELIKSRKSWQTSQGFVFPGKKTSIESNKHAQEPDFARLDELRKVDLICCFFCYSNYLPFPSQMFFITPCYRIENSAKVGRSYRL